MKGRSSIRFDDTSSWPPLDALRTGTGGRRPPPVSDLSGRSIAVSFSSGATARYNFADASTVEFSVKQKSGEAQTVRAACEVFAAGADQYIVHVQPGDGELASRALVLDFQLRSALATVSQLDAAPKAGPAVHTKAWPGAIDGRSATAAPAPTADLVGKRVIYDYGDDQVYEHFYLTPTVFTWLCLSGPEQGLADTESCMTYRLRDGVYLFSWQEKVVPCGASVLLDLNHSQTCGAFLGRGKDPTEVLYFTWGARVDRVDSASYPRSWDPARLPLDQRVPSET
ncbi:MAG: MoaF C-terminal domain-containing protein [Acidimicrobiales bacterium]